MEPVTTGLIYAAAMAAIATARPKWEPNRGNERQYVLRPADISPLSDFGIADAAVYPVSAAQFPSGVDRIVSELNGYGKFGGDWNGEGALAPTAESVKEAIDFIRAFPAGLALPSPTISVGGEIGFYWSSAAGYVDLQIESLGHASLYIRNRKTGQDRFDDDIDWRTVGRQWYQEKLSILQDPLQIAA
ncbi:MAG: hypothetical protein KDD77_07365 [Caldilineaceae bacterium]|nr:hypothetical protein [Caldilineaceae bacterium]